MIGRKACPSSAPAMPTVTTETKLFRTYRSFSMKRSAWMPKYALDKADIVREAILRQRRSLTGRHRKGAARDSYLSQENQTQFGDTKVAKLEHAKRAGGASDN